MLAHAAADSATGFRYDERGQLGFPLLLHGGHVIAARYYNQSK